jgi:hypothetical protein
VLEPQVSVSTKEIFAAALTGQSKALKIPPFFRGRDATTSKRWSWRAIPRWRRTSNG